MARELQRRFPAASVESVLSWLDLIERLKHVAVPLADQYNAEMLSADEAIPRLAEQVSGFPADIYRDALLGTAVKLRYW